MYEHYKFKSYITPTQPHDACTKFPWVCNYLSSTKEKFKMSMSPPKCVPPSATYTDASNTHLLWDYGTNEREKSVVTHML